MTLNASLERLVSYPGVYDAIQILAGRPLVASTLRKWFANERGLVVDVGGGTGSLKTMLPPAARHVCVEVDPLKLSGYAAKFRDGLPLYGDAVRLPVRSGSAAVVAFIAVSHHLTDDELETALAEIARVQAPAGSFFFFDAIWVPDRRASRFLWQRDRGAHPRTTEQIVGQLRKHFDVVEQFEYTVWHRYLGCRCRARRTH